MLNFLFCLFLASPGNLTIVVTEEGPPQYAAETLQTYIDRMAGVKLPIARESASPRIVIRVRAGAVKHDGFHLFRDGEDIVIEAGQPGGCVHGAYALLERMGCRFYGPEPLGVVIPRVAALILPDKLEILREPDFPNRFPSSGTPEQHLAWGFNYTQSHDPKMKSMGLRSFGFGHLWPDLCDRQYFADVKKPPAKMDFAGKESWLPADKGGKRRQTNKALCFSNPDALEWFTDNAANYFMAHHAGGDYYNLWSADEWTIDLCRCEKCRTSGLNDTDWYLVTHNAIRRKLTERGWKGLFGWIVYHGSETVPVNVDLLDHGKNMDFMYAPRPRGGTCRGSFLSSDPVTTKYRANLQGWNDYLKKQAFEGTRTVFEYYYDLVLMWPFATGRTFMTPRHSVMQEDIRYYKEQGFDGFFDCNPPHGVWWPDPLSRTLYHRLLWDTKLDLAAARKDFFANYYGPCAENIQKIREEVEARMFEPPTAEIVAGLKDLDKEFEACQTEEMVLAARVKGMRLWVRYCAMCKESELHEKVTRDDEKGYANEEAIGKFLKKNAAFFTGNNLIGEEDLASLSGWLLGRCMTKFPKGKALAMKNKLTFEVGVSGEIENRPRYYCFDNEPKMYWDSGKASPGWIELKFREPREVNGIELVVWQGEEGKTRHEVIVETAEGEKNVHVFDGTTKPLETLNYAPGSPLAGVRRVRILTTESVGNVGWGEIRIR